MIRPSRLLSTFLFFLSCSLPAACAQKEAPALDAPAGALETDGEPAPVAGDAPVLPTADASEASLAERRVIHRASLTLAAEAVADTADSAVALVEQAQGYVASRNDRHAGAHVTESVLTLRVPAARFTALLGELKERGQVVQEQISGQDVTAEFVDVKARLKAQRILEQRLLALSTEQQAVGNLLEVERELSRVRSEIERLEGQQRVLSDQTSYGTVDLVIRSPEQPRIAGVVGIGSRLGNAVGDGIEMSVAVTVGLIQIGFAFLPFLPLPFCGYLLYRMRRRRQALGRA